MYKLLNVLLVISLCACSSVSISSGRQKVIFKPQKKPCNIHRKEIDPNCKIEDNSILTKKEAK